MKKIILLLIIAGGVLVWGFWGGWVESNIKQPIEFPHKTHLDLKLACTTCHQRAEKGLAAGRPPTTLCLACHAGGETNSQEVKKIRAFGQKGQEIPWKRVWRLPSHVFFSHRIHVMVAKVKCQTCHGPMETLTSPPVRPLKRLTMNDCIDCHEKGKRPKGNEKKGAKQAKAAVERVTSDCIACHR